MCVFEAARRSAAPSWLTPAISSSSPSSLDSAKVFLGSKRGVTHFSIMLSIVWWSWLLAANGDMLSMSLGRRCGALTALCSSSNGRTELKWFAISLSPFSSFFPGWPSQCRSRYCELRSPLQPPDAVADNGGNCNGVGGRTDGGEGGRRTVKLRKIPPTYRVPAVFATAELRERFRAWPGLGQRPQLCINLFVLLFLELEKAGLSAKFKLKRQKIMR